MMDDNLKVMETIISLMNQRDEARMLLKLERERLDWVIENGYHADFKWCEGELIGETPREVIDHCMSSSPAFDYVSNKVQTDLRKFWKQLGYTEEETPHLVNNNKG